MKPKTQDRPTQSLRHTPTEIDEAARELLIRAGLEAPTLEFGVELRATDDTTGVVTFGGYAVRWDSPTIIREWWNEYVEIFRRGSWAKTIAERGAKADGGNGAIKLMYKHDFGSGSWGGGATAGVVTSLVEDEIGVRFEAATIDTSTGRDLAAELRAGVIDRVSFGFDSIRDLVTAGVDGALDIVERIEVRVFEISPVNWPAYETSTIDYARDAIGSGEFVDALKKTLAELRSGGTLTESRVARITEARDLMNEVLSTATPPEAEPSSDTRAEGDAEIVTPSDTAHAALAVRARALEIQSRI